MLASLRHHRRFIDSFALGLAAGLLPFWLDPIERLLLFSVTFCLCYLARTGYLMRHLSAATLRKHAGDDDEGMPLIILIAMSSVAINLWAIANGQISGGNSHLTIALALCSLPLSWAMIHTVMAFHYAHMWYAKGSDNRCLAFPGLPPDGEAGIWDFLYYSFVLGMTAQTADISTLTTRVRRITLLHSVFSFVHNTVLLALAVSAIAGAH